MLPQSWEVRKAGSRVCRWRLSGPLCDALTGQDGGQATLEMLEQANLFVVPLDNDRSWYRYHHLFGELLELRLRQTQPEQISALHRRASGWYKRNGFSDQAIDHALLADSPELAARLIREQAEDAWQRGGEREEVEQSLRDAEQAIDSRSKENPGDTLQVSNPSWPI
jgi:ATP/maltotriose-dependent transcriptional regulator MalT